jgi:hypothetical protein
MNGCRLHEHVLSGEYRAVTLENELLSVTFLPEKGADIYSLVYKPRELDVLWKSPVGLRAKARGIETSSGNSQVSWLDQYEGGWQEIFPNGGAACTYKGAPLGFHGEASVSPWDYRVVSNSAAKIAVEFTVNLGRSPFRLTRVVIVEAKVPRVVIEEKVTNYADEEMHFMWGHHPGFGAPFLDSTCRLHIPAGRIQTHDAEMPSSRTPTGVSGSWPMFPGRDEQQIDLSVIPPEDQRISELHYISELQDGWYGITSGKHNFGFGLVWPKAVFPYLWYWLELKGSFGYPWYGRAYVMALEPFTSIPGSGLERAIENNTAPTLGPQQSIEARLVATFFEPAGEIESISADGLVSC